MKIGDLGLSGLLEKRYSNKRKSELKTIEADIYAVGLCVLELISGWKRCSLDKNLFQVEFWAVLRRVKEESARIFISKCLGPEISRLFFKYHSFFKKN